MLPSMTDIMGCCCNSEVSSETSSDESGKGYSIIPLDRLRSSEPALTGAQVSWEHAPMRYREVELFR